MRNPFSKREAGLAAVTAATAAGVVLSFGLTSPDTAPAARDALSTPGLVLFFLLVFALIETLVLWLLYGSWRALILMAGLIALVAVSFVAGSLVFGVA